MKHETFDNKAVKDAGHKRSASQRVLQPDSGFSQKSEPAITAVADKKSSRTIRAFSLLLFSSLTRRIVFLNLSALAVLLSGILYLNQFRDGLVTAYKNSLITQGRIIASAIAASATVDTNAITIDPDKLLELQAGESVRPAMNSLDNLSSLIDPEKVAPLLRSLIQPTNTRARIYDQDGILVLDSKFLYSGGQVLRYDLPASNEPQRVGNSQKLGKFLNWLLRSSDMGTYKEYPNSGLNYPEVVAALTGANSAIDRVRESGEQVISVAVPIQRLRVVSGVLLLSTEGDVIDRYVTSERLAILRIFLVAAIVIIVLSVLLAGTIANPLRKLSDAAIRVRRGINTREELPDYSARQDEIGTLSSSMRDMTKALYSRIEAIERFAADVSHELKNPLTSLRSAVETLPLAKTDVAKARLAEVIQHDVRRLDRLITDIADASRLDAELAREKAAPMDIRQLLENIVSMSRDRKAQAANLELTLDVQALKSSKDDFCISGHEDRLARVIINLIENARSFVPKNNGKIRVWLKKERRTIIIGIDDNGPGIAVDNFDQIFERFYTDRPDSQEFGQNSGLGLSISRQIIDAHGGTIHAENSTDSAWGARFIIKLPIAGSKPSSKSENRQRK